MEFKLTIDITDRLADAINALSAAIAESPRKAPPQCAQEAPECAEAPEPVVTQAEPENAKIDPPEPQESAPVVDEERAADCAGVQFHCPTPTQALPAVSTDADVATTPQEKPEPEKPKKKKSAKKVVAEAPAPAEAPQPESKPQPETPAVEAPEPVKADAPKTAGDDPMCGMTVVDAVKALVDEIQEKGIDMAQVNARVRAKANEIGLAYASAACLIKAIGYTDARKVALGEK